MKVVKGTAPLLIRTTTNAGKITIIARTYFGGVNSPKPDTLVVFTQASSTKLLYRDEPRIINNSVRANNQLPVISDVDRKKQQSNVEKDQQFFESTERKN